VDAGADRAAADAESWYRFARVQMLLLGASLAAVGAGFFVAANWDELTAYTRMGMLAALMTAVTLLAARLGLHSLSGRVAALLGGLGFGPLMALVGQTYQTGADAWQLFAAWSAGAAGVCAGDPLLGRVDHRAGAGPPDGLPVGVSVAGDRALRGARAGDHDAGLADRLGDRGRARAGAGRQ
jgi:hypothetical protein